MPRFALVLLLTLVSSFAFAGTTIFRNATVVPMTGKQREVRADVVVRDNRIVSVGHVRRVPKGALVVDATDRYLIPGLADAHAHLPGHDGTDIGLERYFDLMLARGVTTLRVMRGDAEQLQWKREIEANKRFGPQLYVSSAPIWSEEPLSPEATRALVDQAADEHFDFIKFLGGLSVASYDAMMDESARRHIAVTGHVPKDIGLAHAVEQHQHGVEHVSAINNAFHADERSVDGLFKTMAREHICHSGNAFWYGNHVGARSTEELDGLSGLEYIPVAIHDGWRNDVQKAIADTATREKWIGELSLYAKLLKRMNDAGVPLLVSPSDGEYVVPGFAMLEEMRFFATAGIEPYDILRAATRNASDSLGGDFGVIARGARADLVLLGSDPLQNIDNIASIEGVMVNGRWLPRADLDARLARWR